MFKRVGPNAMKGRGIGSARGRATIMRGEQWIEGGTDIHTRSFAFPFQKLTPIPLQSIHSSEQAWSRWCCASSGSSGHQTLMAVCSLPKDKRESCIFPSPL